MYLLKFTLLKELKSNFILTTQNKHDYFGVSNIIY